MFPREAAIFDLPTPHIIVAWDGDKIDYVPIPVPQGGFAQGALLRLTSDEVVSLIRNFLSSKGFALPGLFLRIHSRDAITEYDFVPYLPFGCVWKLMCFWIVSEPCSSPNRLSSPSVTPQHMFTRRIIVSKSSQTRLDHHLRYLCRVSVVLMSICIHPSVRSSLVVVFASKTSFAPR